MSVREILKMGHPGLLALSQPVQAFNTPELNALISDLVDTMNHARGAGLAAPQIGVLKQVVIFGAATERYPDAEAVPFTILINPKIDILSPQQSACWEGCLSIPGLRGLVQRPAHIRYQGFNEKGERIEREVKGFHATVVQHECDHLNGILYPQRMQDMTQFGFSDLLD